MTKGGVSEFHCTEPFDCGSLPPHTMCWEDASGMIRWKNERLLDVVASISPNPFNSPGLDAYLDECERDSAK